MYRLIDRFGMYFAPTLYMENVKIDGVWYKGPIITNHFGHWDTECLTLGVEQERIRRERSVPADEAARRLTRLSNVC